MKHDLRHPTLRFDANKPLLGINPSHEQSEREKMPVNISRRTFLNILGTLFVVTGMNCSVIQALAGAYSRPQRIQYFPGYDVYAPVPLNGCILSADAAQSFRTHSRLLPSTGNPFLDQRFQKEYLALASTMGHQPSFAFLDDTHAANAMAVNVDIVNGTSQFGAILFGVRLLVEQLSKSHPLPLDNTWTIAAIMAHEWTHIVQFATGLRSSLTRNTELMADFMAGWYLGAKQRFYISWGQGSDVRAAFHSFFDMGDTNFDQPDHHGTHEERMKAIMQGVEFSYQTGADFSTALRRGKAYLYLS